MNNMTVGSRVLSILKSKGLKQKDLAEFLKTGTSTVNGWNQENRNPSCDMIIPICEFLECSCEYLLTGKDDKIHSFLSDEDREWLDLIHALPEQAQNDFRGAMRLYIDLHGSSSQSDNLEQAT